MVIRNDVRMAFVIVILMVMLPGASIGFAAQQGDTPIGPNLLPSPTEFSQLAVESRRHIMRAWAHRSPERAGNAILPLLEAGILDTDRTVRQFALGVLQRIVHEGNRAAELNRALVTDQASDPGLQQALVRGSEDPDPVFRAGVVTALAGLETAPSGEVDALLVQRLVTETAYVRVQIVTALAGRAKRGSVEARAAVLAALGDPEAAVMMSAVKAMRSLRAPEALATLVREVDAAAQPGTRKMVVQVLAVYGESLTPHLDALRESLALESDASVKTELRRLILGLERNRPLPR